MNSIGAFIRFGLITSLLHLICTTAVAQTGCTNVLANNYNPEAVLEDNSCTFGPLKRIVHEVYYTDDGAVPDYPEGYTTFRIYAELDDSLDAISAVFASEDMGDSLFLGGYQGVFWNHLGGGAVGSEISPGFFDLVPAAEYDSYVTIGIPDNSVPGSIQHAEYIPLDAINSTLGPDTTGNQDNLWMRDGAWFAMGTPDHVFGTGEFNRVLLAQITCKTQPRYALNIQVFNDGIPGQSIQYFHSPTVEFDYMSPAYHLSYPYGLCNDPLACNYEPVTYPLYADNDLCVYGDCFGCTDPLALNYDSSVWIDDDSCEYGELGCSDPLAYNYSSTAVYSPEGTCVYEDYAIVVEPYYFDDGSVDGYPDGFHTYRIYITGQDSLEFISRVYAAIGETSPGFITTYGNGTIWNSVLGGVTSDDINPSIFNLDPSVEYDSFLTIGKTSQEEPGVVLADSSSPNEEFDDVLGIGDSELYFEAGLWLPQYNSPNGFLGADHKILIAQITSDAPICGRLSFDIRLHPDYLYPAVVKDQLFCSPELIACNDELAVNPLESPDSPTENCAYGDYSIEVETVYDDDGMIDGYPEGFSTYRIWAKVDSSGDAVSRVYSEEGMPPLEIVSNGTVWNTNQGIVVGTGLQASDIDSDPVIAYDSYVTIGRTQSSDPGAPILYADGIPGNAFFDTFYTGSTNFACQLGHWYTQAGAINSLANAENRILLAQVTTDGQLSGSLNLHVIRADGSTFEWRDAQFTGPEPAGCTDSTANNYDPLAVLDDGSCAYDPCSVNEVLVSWCNYDEMLEEWIPGIHVTPDFGGSCLSWLLILTNTADTNEQYFYQANSFDEFGDGITVIIEDILLNDCTVWDLEIQTTGFIENYSIVASECGAVVGCTDSIALNFNSVATCDDGSCNYAPCSATMLGDWICEYDTELNEITQGFEITLTWDGVCSFTDLHVVSSEGTVDEWIDLSIVELESGVPWLLEFEAPVASQYSLSAYTAGLSAVSLVDVTWCVAGCTDPEAENYDSSALFDDGSCEYAVCIENEVTFTLFLQNFADELGWNLLDDENQWIAGGAGYADNSTWSDIWCLEDGCYTLELSDSFNDGWNGSYYVVQDSGGEVIRTGSIETGGTDLDVLTLNADCPTDGCTDPAAANYEPFATIEDGSCQYATSEPLPEGEENEIEITYNAGVSGELDVLLGGLEQGIVYQAQIYNSQGNLMSEQHFTAETATGSLSLDTSRLAAGVYYFVIHTDHQLSARQFIKL